MNGILCCGLIAFVELHIGPLLTYVAQIFTFNNTMAYSRLTTRISQNIQIANIL
jgi:hypothetical protein